MEEQDCDVISVGSDSNDESHSSEEAESGSSSDSDFGHRMNLLGNLLDTDDFFIGNNIEEKEDDDIVEITPFLCDQCVAIFETAEGLQAHYHESHKERTATIKHFLCTACHQKFETRESWESHLNNSHAMECDHCQLTCYGNEALRAHCERRHPPEYECDVCKEKFVGLKKFEKHRVIHGAKKLYQCSTCGLELNFKASMDFHMKVHETMPTPTPEDLEEIEKIISMPPLLPPMSWPSPSGSWFGRSADLAESDPDGDESSKHADSQNKISPKRINLSPVPGYSRCELPKNADRRRGSSSQIDHAAFEYGPSLSPAPPVKSRRGRPKGSLNRYKKPNQGQGYARGRGRGWGQSRGGRGGRGGRAPVGNGSLMARVFGLGRGRRRGRGSRGGRAPVSNGSLMARVFGLGRVRLRGRGSRGGIGGRGRSVKVVSSSSGISPEASGSRLIPNVLPAPEMPSTSSGLQANQDEDIWCVCRKPYDDRPMIMCDFDTCPYGWYHLDCVGMAEQDVPEGKWYCNIDRCRVARSGVSLQ